jgi:hypothetical protein
MVGGQAIELGGTLPTRLNPLDEGSRAVDTLDVDCRVTVTSRRRDLLCAVAETSLGRALLAVEATALFAALDAAVRDNSTPILSHVVDAMFRPPANVDGSTVTQLVDDGRQVAHAPNRLVRGDLSGLFGRPSTTRFDPALPMVSLDLLRIQGSDHLIALVMTCASAWMEAALADPRGGQRWVIYDEAWRLLRQASLLARMQSQWRLPPRTRHRRSDGDPPTLRLDAVGEANSEARNLALGLLADCSAKIIYAQESENWRRLGRHSDRRVPKRRSFRSSLKARGCGGSRTAPSWFGISALPTSSNSSTPTPTCLRTTRCGHSWVAPPGSLSGAMKAGRVFQHPFGHIEVKRRSTLARRTSPR